MAILAVTNTFVSGATITASGHNQNFSDVVSWANGNVGEDNLDTMAGTVSWSVSTNVLGISMTNGGTEGSLSITNNANLAAGKACLLITQNNTGLALRIDSTKAGVAMPSMTSTQRDAISSPAERTEIYNNTTKQKEVYNGVAWIGRNLAAATKTANYTILASDDLIIANADSTASFNLTLPDATAMNGKMIRVKKTGSNIARTITLLPAGSDTINSTSSYLLYTLDEYVEIMPFGSDWFILNHKTITEWSSSLSFGTTGLGTLASSVFMSRRVGDSLQVRFFMEIGTPATATGKITLPVTVDAAKLLGDHRSSLGNFEYTAASSNNIYSDGTSAGQAGIVGFDTGETTNVFFSVKADTDASGFTYAATNASTYLNAAAQISGEFLIPVSGWKV